MANMIYTIEGNTSGGSTLVANGGCVAKKKYLYGFKSVAYIIRPNYRPGEAAKVMAEMSKWIGYLEKKSNKHLEDKFLNAGYNNFNYFAAWLKKNVGAPYVNGVAWCDMFVDFCFCMALGVARAKELLGDWSAYTPTSYNLLTKADAEEQTFQSCRAGDIIFFKNSTRICHTGVIAHNTELDSAAYVSVDTSYSAEQFVADVCRITGTKTAEAAFKKTVTLRTDKNRNHPLVLPLQKRLKSMGLYTGIPDKDFGELTEIAVDNYQTQVLKYSKADGEVTAKGTMWRYMLTGRRN